MKTRTLKFWPALAATLLFVFSLGSAWATDLRSGLIAYWPLDVDNSGTAPDLTSFGNHLMISNGSSIVSGQVSNAFSFDGISQYLSIAHGTNFNDPSGLPIYNAPLGYSIAMWVKGAAQPNFTAVFSEANTTTNTPVFFFICQNSKLGVSLRTLSGTIPINNKLSTTTVWDGAWHHIAWVDTRGTVVLYVDGVPDATSFNYSYPGFIPFNTTALGASVGTNTSAYYNGLVDDVALWERPLSQAEVQSVMTNSIPTPIPAAAPTILQALSSTNALGDRPPTFSITAVGAHPLAYQWYKDGALLAGQTNALVAVPPLTSPTTNAYSIVVANSLGAATSTVYLVVLSDPPAALASGLINYWPLDTVNAGTPNSTPDLYYRHNDMALVPNAMDASALASGVFGNALSFNGTTQYGKRVGGSSIYLNTNYSISFWVNGGSQNGKECFSEGSTSTGTPLFMLGTPTAAPFGTLRAFVRSDDNVTRLQLTSTRTVFDGTWHHVVWVDQNGKAKLYVDGVLDETDFTYTRSPLTANTTTIGAILRTSAGNWFAGAIDDVALWNRKLTYTEIQQLQVATAPPPSLQAPTISQQPLNSTNAMGDRVTVSVTASGSAPMTYQWYKDGVALSGYTDASFSYAATAPATNRFYVAITNSAYFVVSSTNWVVVVPDTAPNLVSSLVAYWSMDTVLGAAPTAISPDSGYAHNDLALVTMDGNALVTGRFSNALAFDGWTQYAKRVDGSPIYSATNYTISMWVNGSSGQTTTRVFSEGSTANSTPLFTIGTDGPLNLTAKAQFFARNDSNSVVLSANSTRDVFDSTWHHLVWVDENGKAKLYVDGVLDETDFTYSRNGTFSLNVAALGAVLRASAGYLFWGTMDEVALWNRRLSYTEIQQLQTATIPPLPPVKPSFTQQPVSSTNALGDRLTLSAAASGTGPLSYQWYENGAAIDGATNRSLSILLAAAATNNYWCVAANSLGSATSIWAAVTVPADPPADVANGLISYWPLDTVTVSATTSSPDVYYQHCDLTLPNMDANALVSGQFSNALAFDGATQYGYCMVGSPIYNATNYTVSLWVKGYGSGQATRVFSESSTLNNSPLFTLGTDTLPTAKALLFVRNNEGAVLTGATGWASTRDVFDGAWHHLVWVDENGKGKLYVDGVLDETDFTYFRTGSFPLNTTSIGAVLRASAGNLFSGAIDEVAVWNRRLTQTEINHVRSHGIPAAVAPNPFIRITDFRKVGGNVQLTIETQWPGQPIAIQQCADLASGNWVAATGGGITQTQGTTVTAQFAVGSQRLFYRVAGQ